MWGIALVLVLLSTFIVALSAGAVGSFLLAIVASVAGALLGAAMKWSEQSIYALQMAAPIFLLLTILVSTATDRIVRRRDRRYFS